jgi:alkylated DNA nucleotide flippase Atl1
MKTSKEKFDNANQNGGTKTETPKGLMYISTPTEISEIIKKIPKGKVITVADIASQLAKKHGTDWTCPITTGIFTSLVANYSEEAGLGIPYWRVVKAKGVLYDQYLGMESHQSDFLKSEGWKIVHRGKNKIAAVDLK